MRKIENTPTGITQLQTDDGTHLIGIGTSYSADGGIHLVIDNGPVVTLTSADVVLLLETIQERF